MRLIPLLLLINCALFGASFERVADRCLLTIQTPTLKGRQTSKIRLDNGLEAYLISDPDTPTSGAALAVNVGSWDNPKERLGMAHFVEHMLFLGTEKYPEEEGYTRYLDEHGGSRNAFTATDRTVYMFSVNNDGFSEAVDRFGQFFVAPLFSPSGVDRESKAIHQEYCKNVPVDPWRVHYVKKAVANPKHPHHDFCIGNDTTLKKIAQDELKKWYHNHYSANLMHLVVISDQPLDTLEQQVTEIFSEVPNRHIAKTTSPEPLHSSSMCGKMVAVAPVKELQILELSWEVPREFSVERSRQVDRLVGYVLGHEGEGSLLSQLKKEGLAEGLGAGNNHEGKDQSAMSISVQLTPLGLEKKEVVIERCFEAIKLLQERGVPRYLFDEITGMEKLKYCYQSRIDTFNYMVDLAVKMVDEPLDTFPMLSQLPVEYSPEKVFEFVSHLTVDRCQFTLVATPEQSGLTFDRQEPWLGAQYTVLDIDRVHLNRWRSVSANKEIALPAPNRFIPTDVTIASTKTDESFPKPYLLDEDFSFKMYMAQDTQFLVPEAAWSVHLRTPHIKSSSAKSKVLADLFCECVRERMSQTTYKAQMAGLKHGFYPTHNGVAIQIQGFHEKAPLLLSTLVDQLTTTVPTNEEFHLYKERAFRRYLNEVQATPFALGVVNTQHLIYKDYVLPTEKLEMLSHISYADLKKFSQNLFDRCFVEAMFYGNMSETDGKRVATDLKERLASSQAYAPVQHVKQVCANLGNMGAPTYLVRNSNLPDHAVILTADLGEASHKKRAAQEILTKGLEEPFFSELRTKQQTGYLVRNWSQESEGRLYSFFALQSSSHTPRDLLARFELFLENSLQNLAMETIPKERFESIKASLIEKLEKPAENPKTMGNLLFALAFQYEGDFDRLEQRKEAYQQLSYEEFIELSYTFLGTGNKKRLAVCVEGKSSSDKEIRYRESADVEHFKRSLFERSP